MNDVTCDNCGAEMPPSDLTWEIFSGQNFCKDCELDLDAEPSSYDVRKTMEKYIEKKWLGLNGVTNNDV